MGAFGCRLRPCAALNCCCWKVVIQAATGAPRRTHCFFSSGKNACLSGTESRPTGHRTPGTDCKQRFPRPFVGLPSPRRSSARLRMLSIELAYKADVNFACDSVVYPAIPPSPWPPLRDVPDFSEHAVIIAAVCAGVFGPNGRRCLRHETTCWTVAKHLPWTAT